MILPIQLSILTDSVSSLITTSVLIKKLKKKIYKTKRFIKIIKLSLNSEIEIALFVALIIQKMSVFLYM